LATICICLTVPLQRGLALGRGDAENDRHDEDGFHHSSPALNAASSAVALVAGQRSTHEK
jgi:hypothetical protein